MIHQLWQPMPRRIVHDYEFQCQVGISHCVIKTGKDRLGCTSGLASKNQEEWRKTVPVRTGLPGSNKKNPLKIIKGMGLAGAS